MNGGDVINSQSEFTRPSNVEIALRFLTLRKGRDLNPRSPCGDTRSPSARTRPLCDPSNFKNTFSIIAKNSAIMPICLPAR